ncbi:hypothetical protein AMTRI_Chr13g122670 [Amborella trichopoda]
MDLSLWISIFLSLSSSRPYHFLSLNQREPRLSLSKPPKVASSEHQFRILHFTSLSPTQACSHQFSPLPVSGSIAATFSLYKISEVFPALSTSCLLPFPLQWDSQICFTRESGSHAVAYVAIPCAFRQLARCCRNIFNYLFFKEVQVLMWTPTFLLSILTFNDSTHFFSGWFPLLWGGLVK